MKLLVQCVKKYVMNWVLRHIPSLFQLNRLWTSFKANCVGNANQTGSILRSSCSQMCLAELSFALKNVEWFVMEFARVAEMHIVVVTALIPCKVCITIWAYNSDSLTSGVGRNGEKILLESCFLAP